MFKTFDFSKKKSCKLQFAFQTLYLCIRWHEKLAKISVIIQFRSKNIEKFNLNEK